MTPSSPLQLDNLRKSYGKNVAVRNASLAAAAGEFISLLGPSGCGKTTTLRMIAGFERPDAGRVWFGDEDVTDLPPNRRNIGMVFQNYALFPHMTVVANVAYGLRMRGVPRDEARARAANALNLVRLKGKDDNYPGQLSGGQQQRVALARALVISPALLLLDEPLSNLDVKLRVELRHEIREIQREANVTTILVTHDQDEALSISDRVVVMNAGVVEQCGAPSAIYDMPSTLFSADFVGAANFIVGTCQKEDGRQPGRLCHASGISFRLDTDVQADVGSTLTVALRPETIGIAEDDGSALDPAAISDSEIVTRATVLEVTYHGAFSEILCRIADGLVLRVMHLNRDGADGTDWLSSGSTVRLDWSVRSMRRVA